MLLKRIEGKTLPEALDRVREQCGKDALVVETRATKSGFMVVASKREPVPTGRDQAGRGPLLSQWTRGFRDLAQKATDFGMSQPILGAVERAMLGTRVEMSRPGDPALPNLATRVLASLVRTTEAVEDGEVADFHRVALIGPTGVGKTTTLAKLAARARSRGERVAIITIDTFRVAAVEQLRAFADLLAVPFHVAFTASDLKRAIQEHAEFDRIYIDTTGKSPNDSEAMPVLEGHLRAAGCASLLCLAAGTRRRDSDRVLDAYDRLGPDAICLTKWDETVMPGEALAAVIERGLPLSHLCIGQEVPADIVPANAMALAGAAFDVEVAGASA